MPDTTPQRPLRRGQRAEPPKYYTTHTCSNCGCKVDGIHGRWACGACGECSEYREPPEGWQADPGYDT